MARSLAAAKMAIAESEVNIVMPVATQSCGKDTKKGKKADGKGKESTCNDPPKGKDAKGKKSYKGY